MKKTLLISGLLIAIAVPAFAQLAPTVPGTLSLAWNDCDQGLTAAVNKTNACTSTAGFDAMYASFDPPVAMPAYVGNNGIIDIQTNSGGGVLSAWWRFDLANTTCHGQKISHVADLSLDPAAVGCVELFGANGGASGGGNYVTPSSGSVAPPSARIKEIWAFTTGGSAPIGPGSEYYAFKVTILNALNAGFTLATCPGCLDKACIVLNQINLSQPAPTPDIPLTQGPQQYITWQNGTGAAPCPAATPTHNNSWGQVKALYR